MNSPLRILVVEDNRLVATTYDLWIKQFDESQNIDIEIVGRYSDAVHRIEDGMHGNLPAISVVILDLMLPADPMLPDGVGVSVLKDVRNRWWELPIVVVSGAGFPENEVLHAGADDYLNKGSFSGKDLVHTIRKAWVRRDSMLQTRSVRESIRVADEGLRNTESAIQSAREALAHASAKLER